MKLNSYTAFYIFLVGVLTISSSAMSQNGITYAAKSGRFGDYVFLYCECRWLSYVHNLEMYYKPFEYGDQLVASIRHKHARNSTKKEELWIKSALQINPNDKDMLYVTNDHFTDDFTVD